MRMLRRLSVLAAALVLLGTAPAATSLDREMREVARLRGLTFLHSVKEKTIDRSQLRPLIKEQLEKEIPYSIDDYIRVLKALQLIDASTPDVAGKMFDLYDAQVLAFYDPTSHTYFSIRQLPDALAGVPDSSALRESVVLHELTHALQDQRYDATARDKALQHDTDGELAYHALLEGEATLVMLDSLLQKSGQSFDDAVKSDVLLGMGAMAAADQSIAPDVPKYFVESLKFPYIDGLKLVVLAYRRGGWKEVDRLHSNPPRTTREVLHPEEYFARLASGQKGDAPFNPPRGKNVITVERLGEFHWRYFVGDRAQGWVDDRVTITRDGQVTAETRWETAEKAAAFRDAYVTFLRGRGIDPRVTTDGKSVTVVYRS